MVTRLVNLLRCIEERYVELGLGDMAIFFITICFLILIDIDIYCDMIFLIYNKSFNILLGPQRNQKVDYGLFLLLE